MSWATHAADALVATQQLATEAIAAGADTVDPDALATQIHHYRSACHFGITQTATRSDAVMKRHDPLAHRLIDRQTTTSVSPSTAGTPDSNRSERDIRMIKLR